MTNPIEYRELQGVEDLEQIVDLEIAIWKLRDRDATPASIMRPIAKHGGVVIGAYDNERMIGLALAFPAKNNNKWILWSHMTGVHPDYQGKSIGFELKQAQRHWALANGYDEINWTFDPLIRGNANFNLHRLGATASVYHQNYYGIMQDEINPAIASDRLEVRWKLKAPRVKTLANGNLIVPESYNVSDALLTPDLVMNKDLLENASKVYVAVPRHFNKLSHPELLEWRLTLRTALQGAFERGFTAIDFVETNDKSYYVLENTPTWFLYVLRCKDDSLYTGIALDVLQRLDAHNRGRGAAYTATRRPVEVIGIWRFSGKSAALKAELAFKRLPRQRKLTIIAKQLPFQDAAFEELDQEVFSQPLL